MIKLGKNVYYKWLGLLLVDYWNILGWLGGDVRLSYLWDINVIYFCS